MIEDQKLSKNRVCHIIFSFLMYSALTGACTQSIKEMENFYKN